MKKTLISKKGKFFSFTIVLLLLNICYSFSQNNSLDGV